MTDPNSISYNTAKVTTVRGLNYENDILTSVRAVIYNKECDTANEFWLAIDDFNLIEDAIVHLEAFLKREKG